MIDTTSFETDIIIKEIDENRKIKRIDLVDQNGKVVSSYKYRSKKNKTSANNNQNGEE